MHVFMAVTPDKYELPIAVEDTAGKLARTLKVKEGTIYTGVRRKCAGSFPELSAKYGIPGHSILKNWIKKYNSDMELKDYNPRQEVYMASARRKTTITERREIVDYCISNKRDYKGIAEEYDVSYSQVYSWVRKYNTTGEEGLSDKRGLHKSDE